MVLLAGAGNSAHVFDEFAPRFTDRFHVYAFTRRGFGESSQPRSGYDTETLAGDILDVLDGLKISKAHLVGHSLAGTEMTYFARQYPDRVSRMVYLDAAYDLVDQKSLANAMAGPKAPEIRDQDLASAVAFGAYVSLTQGVALPEPEIHAIYQFSPNGRYFSAITNPAILQAIIDGESHMNYTGLKSPALAIYTVPDVLTDMYPWMTPTSPDWDLANASFLAAQSSLAVQRQKFKENAPAVTSSIIEMHGVPHYLFLAKPDEVFEMVSTFLLTP
jgi:pimeloyl-ACP methyl ester carboxylesterase